jgi:hypothetical protein
MSNATDTSLAQQDALSNAFIGIFAIAIIVISQLGLGGIERRTFDAVYGRVEAGEKQRSGGGPGGKAEKESQGRVQTVVSMIWVLVEGDVKFVAGRGAAQQPDHWQEDTRGLTPADEPRNLYRVNIGGPDPGPREWLLRSDAQRERRVWIIADDLLVNHTCPIIAPGAQWQLTMQSANGPLTVSPCGQ